MADSSTVSPKTRDRIVMALWLPLIFALVGVGLGVGLLAVGAGLVVVVMAATGQADVIFEDVAGAVGSSVDVSTTLLIVGAFVAFLYITLARETMGSATVEESLDDTSDLTPDGGENE